MYEPPQRLKKLTVGRLVYGLRFFTPAKHAAPDVGRLSGAAGNRKTHRYNRCVFVHNARSLFPRKLRFFRSIKYMIKFHSLISGIKRGLQTQSPFSVFWRVCPFPAFLLTASVCSSTFSTSKYLFLSAVWQAWRSPASLGASSCQTIGVWLPRN